MDDLDLAENLRRAKDGDERGFAALWRTLQPSVLRYLRVLVDQAAEDVAAETWLQVARDIATFRGGPEQFRAWVFAIARNRALDELRRSVRRREDSTEPGELPVRPGGSDTEEEALSRLGTEAALAVIATLPRDQAEAVALRIVAGLNPRQAAAVLGKRPGAVRTAAMRGLRRLATQLCEPTAVPDGRHRRPPGKPRQALTPIDGEPADRMEVDTASSGSMANGRELPVPRLRRRAQAVRPPSGGVTR